MNTALGLSPKACFTERAPVAVVRGRFSVRLPDSCTTVVAAQPDVWVSVVVAGDDLGRAKVGAVPFAVEARSAESALSASGTLAQQVVPPGAVMAFDLAACPAGWAPLAEARGRTIIGVNTGNGNGLSNRALRATVGSETHTLTVSEMPAHNHLPAAAPNRALSFNVGGSQGLGGGSTLENRVADNDANSTTNLSPAGGGQPHNTMQPSLALLYCRKQ